MGQRKLVSMSSRTRAPSAATTAETCSSVIACKRSCQSYRPDHFFRVVSWRVGADPVIALSEIEQHEVERSARQAQQREARLAFHRNRV
jgi:hypothetical protein